MESSVSDAHGQVKKKPSSPSVHSSIGLWMLVDGIGLAIVAGATIMEGVHLWLESYHLFWVTNHTSMLYWFGGRSLQVSGLTLLIAFAASFQIFPLLELIGMVLISTGPLLNLVSCYLFTDSEDPNYLYKKQWASTELVEFAGMLILDVSLIHMEEIYVLTAEVVGFFVLCCAAALQFNYEANVRLPSVTLRLDTVHSGECFGLILLTCVAFAQYRIKLHKLEHQQKVLHKHSHGTHNHTTMQSPGSIDRKHPSNVDSASCTQKVHYRVQDVHSAVHISSSPISIIDIENGGDDKYGRKVMINESAGVVHVV